MKIPVTIDMPELDSIQVFVSNEDFDLPTMLRVELRNAVHENIRRTVNAAVKDVLAPVSNQVRESIRAEMDKLVQDLVERELPFDATSIARVVLQQAFR